MGYIYLALTIIFTVYGQLVLKWRIGLKGAIPLENFEKLVYLTICATLFKMQRAKALKFIAFYLSRPKGQGY